MLRLYAVDQMNLWEATFPEELFVLNDELAQVDAYLELEKPRMKKSSGAEN